MVTFCRKMTQLRSWRFRLTSGDDADLCQCLRPPKSSCPRKCATDFDDLLEDRRDKMVLGDFNAHHPSWFSRTGDDWVAARGEALDEAVNSSQLVVANLDMPHLPPLPRLAFLSFLSGHFLSNWTWSTLTTFVFDHLPLQSRPALTAESSLLHELPQF